MDTSNDNIDFTPQTVASTNVLLTPSGYLPHEMHFDKDEFLKLQDEYGPFTLEAQASC